MISGRRDRDRSFGHFLSADVGEVDLVFGKVFKQISDARWRRFDCELAGKEGSGLAERVNSCLLYTSPSPRDATLARMPSSA